MRRVLLIEDNPDVRENIAELLMLADYEVFTAVNGQAGVEVAEREIPDVIICDISMPVMNGFEVLEVLGKSHVTAGIPFIFLTARAEESDRTRGIDLGADAYIVKPFDEASLLNTIEARIRKSMMLRRQIEQERLIYIKTLEDMLHITSHRVRKPICTCLGLAQLVEKDTAGNLSREDVVKVLDYVRISVFELDEFTRELTLFLHEAGSKQRYLRLR